jgi:uracil-DNA glycosylase family 4
MLEKPKTCTGCSLENISQGFSIPEGTGAIPVLICGESLGYNELLDGLPFRPQAQAGSILHRVIQKARIDRNSLAFWNLTACKPPQDKLAGQSYEYSAINHCRVHFDKVIEKYKPKVILALGRLPFKHLTGMEGYKLDISTVRGYIFKCNRYDNIYVVPSFHPSYIRRGALYLMGVLMHDLLKSIAIAKGKLIEGQDFLIDPMQTVNSSLGNKIHINYQSQGKIEDALNFLHQIKLNPDLTISYDIETDKSVGEHEDELSDYGEQITQIQFCVSPGTGLALPFAEPYIGLAKQILSTPNPKVGWNNWDFDNPRLEREGFIINGRIDDAMWCMHHLHADLPIGLQFSSSFAGFKFPWKHLSGQDLGFYGVADVDATLQTFNFLKKQLEDRDLWKGYDNYVYKLKPILVDMQNRGLPINTKKQKDFGIEIEARQIEIEKELEGIIPDYFTKYKIYVREPKEVQQAKLMYMLEKGSSSIEFPTEYIVGEDKFIYREVDVEPSVRKTKDIVELERLGVVFNNTNVSTKREQRWCKEIKFNPNSPDQISDYIKYNKHEDLAKKYAVKLAKDNIKIEDFTDAKVSRKKDNVVTSKVVLQKLYENTGDNAYKLFVEYKELSKMKGTYVDGYKPVLDQCENTSCFNGKIIDGDSQGLYELTCKVCNGTGKSIYGRVHTTFTFRPSNGQLSSRAPNIQNFPYHTRLADRFKECIEAPKGYLLAVLDFRGFHNKMMGFLAKDEVYLRIAGLDTHSFITGHVVDYKAKIKIHEPGNQVCCDGSGMHTMTMDDCLNLQDDKLIIFLNGIKKAYKKLRDDQIKHVVHGINFGLSEDGCFKRYRDEFSPNVEEVLKGKRKVYEGEALQKLIESAGKAKVKSVYNIVKKLFPKIFDWQQKTIVEADRQGYIDTPYGFRRWFYAASEVKYNKFGNVERIVKGEEAEQALAFRVANNSHCHMRESIIIINKLGIDKAYNLINCIHDNLVFMSKENEIEDCVKDIRIIMERKSDILKNEIMEEGFFCAIDAKIGKNLFSVEDYKI